MTTLIPSMKTNTKRIYQPIPAGSYPARMVRFMGLGIQPQRPYQGTEKSPAFKISIQFELYSPTTLEPLNAILADGTDTQEPSCLFKNLFLFPSAQRGHTFELAKCFDNTATKSPADLDTYFDWLGRALMVNVTNYTKADGTIGSGVNGFQSILPMLSMQMNPARCELVSFNPYNPLDVDGYNKLYPFQVEELNNAVDSKLIPLIGTPQVKPIKDSNELPSSTPSTAYCETMPEEPINPFYI